MNRTENHSLEQSIQAMIDRLERENVNMHGFMLSMDGHLVASGYYAPFREGQAHRLYSVSKTMTALAIGMLAEEGALKLDQPVCDFFRDWLPPEPDGRLERQTLRDMLRMATCYRSTAYREGVDENWAKAFFTGTPTHEPGTVFHYDTGCSQVLAALVRRLSGREVIDFLEEDYFNRHPTGILFLPDKTYAVSFFASLETNAYESKIASVNKERADMPSLLSYVADQAKQYRDLSPAVSIDDRIIALITCENAITDGRAVLIGRLNEIDYIVQGVEEETQTPDEWTEEP